MHIFIHMPVHTYTQVIDGRVVLEGSFRLNAGGLRITDALNDSLRLRYPQHRQAISAGEILLCMCIYICI